MWLMIHHAAEVLHDVGMRPAPELLQHVGLAHDFITPCLVTGGVVTESDLQLLDVQVGLRLDGHEGGRKLRKHLRNVNKKRLSADIARPGTRTSLLAFHLR